MKEERRQGNVVRGTSAGVGRLFDTSCVSHSQCGRGRVDRAKAGSLKPANPVLGFADS
jgi:hypothetical protein